MAAKIDILLPYWGDVSLFKQTVESILAQTEPNWRLIIADDHYPSLDAKAYIESLHDSRIEYIRHAKNIGVTKNFNYCINAAQSEYCVIIGCDDRMLPTYLETALATIGSADMYQPGVEIIDGNGIVYLPLADRAKKALRIKRPGLYSGEGLATSLSRGQWLYFPSIMWRTKTLQSYHFDEQYTVVEDVVLTFSMILDGATLCLDNTKTFQYRRFSESVSSKEKKKGGVRFKEESQVYADFAKKFQDRGWKKAARAAKLHLTSRIHGYLA